MTITSKWWHTFIRSLTNSFRCTIMPSDISVGHIISTKSGGKFDQNFHQSVGLDVHAHTYTKGFDAYFQNFTVIYCVVLFYCWRKMISYLQKKNYWPTVSHWQTLSKWHHNYSGDRLMNWMYAYLQIGSDYHQEEHDSP